MLKLDEQAVFEILTATLLNGRLAPGLRLGEQQLDLEHLDL